MKLVLTLDEELARALHDLAGWEQRPELTIAAELVQLALTQARPQREIRYLFAGLTDRERQIAALLTQGFTLQQICRRLVFTPNTLKTHLRNMRLKMEARDIPSLRELLAQVPPALME